MAPEYALWGHLTYKADVYSFGVVALEIVSGKNNNNYLPSNRNCVCLIDWVIFFLRSIHCTFAVVCKTQSGSFKFTYVAGLPSAAKREFYGAC